MADVSELITMGIGTPSSIPYFVLMGLGIGTPAPPSSVGGGGATPIRNWNGRQRGNVEVIYRQRTTSLNPEPLILALKVEAKLETSKVVGNKPGFPAQVLGESVPQPRVWPSLKPGILALRLNISGELSRIPAHVTRISRLKDHTDARISTIEQRLDELAAENRRLYAALQEANEEVISLEDRLLLGVD